MGYTAKSVDGYEYHGETREEATQELRDDGKKFLSVARTVELANAFGSTPNIYDMTFDHNKKKEIHATYQSEKTDGIQSEFAKVLKEAAAIKGLDLHAYVSKLFDGFKAEDFKVSATKLANDSRVVNLIPELDKLFLGKIASWPKPTENNRNVKIVTLMNPIFRGIKQIPDEGATKRQKYLIELGHNLKRGGNIFDTLQLANHHFQKDRTKLLNALWVMGEDNQFYSHIGKLGRFHHSSFFGGSAIKAAGEWTVKNGKLVSINGQSGHYKPGIESFAIAVHFLSSKGVIPTGEALIEVWPANTRVATLMTFDQFQANAWDVYPYDPARGDFFGGT